MQTLNGRTLIFELLSSVHQHGRFLVASAQFSAFKIFREYIYIYIYSLVEIRGVQLPHRRL